MGPRTTTSGGRGPVVTDPLRREKKSEVVVVVAVCPAPRCWREFPPIRANQVFCSPACRQAAYRARRRESFPVKRNG